MIISKKGNAFINNMSGPNSISLKYSDTVIDMGANVGTYAIRCARFPVKQVIAYEPTRTTFEILSLTSLPNLKIVNAAIVPDSYKKQDVRLFTSDGIGMTNNIVRSVNRENSYTVEAVKYSDAVAGASIVKLDVERAEYLLLGDLIKSSLRAIIIEFHPLSKKDWKGMICDWMLKVEQAGFETIREPILRPDYHAWSRDGSWIREVETDGQCDILMNGLACCGCGAALTGGDGRSLCPACYDLWTDKQKIGFTQAASRE